MDQLLGGKCLFTGRLLRNMGPRVQGWAEMRAWRIPYSKQCHAKGLGGWWEAGELDVTQTDPICGRVDMYHKGG